MIFNSTKFGFDVSTYQDDPTIAGSVNFDQMVSSGASFVIMRSSVGNMLDVDFQTFKANSRNKIPRAIYHYYWNTISPVIQAQLVLSAIGGEKIEGRVWLDLETTGAGAYSRPANWRAFMQIIEDAGYRTGIYTGYYWWQDYAVKTGEDLSYFYARPLWEAYYTTNPANVLVAGKWSNMMIWQHSSTGGGYAAGVESANIDQNKWNDLYNFETEWQVATTPPTGAIMKKGILTANTLALNVRNSPISGGVITTLLPNDWAYGEIDAASGWLKIQYIIRVSGAREDFTSAYCSANAIYITLFDYVPPAQEIIVTVTINETAKTHNTVVTWKDGTQS